MLRRKKIMDNEENEKSIKPTKRLAVLETADHADEIVALAGGQDRMEYTYPTAGANPSQPATAFDRSRFGAGHHWEKLRPLEASSAAMPVISYTERWRHHRGRFGAVKGFGHLALHLLLARRP
jgi:hypothetical protein